MDVEVYLLDRPDVAIRLGHLDSVSGVTQLMFDLPIDAP